MYCKLCNSQISDDASFCPICGAAVSDEDSGGTTLLTENPVTAQANKGEGTTLLGESDKDNFQVGQTPPQPVYTPPQQNYYNPQQSQPTQNQYYQPSQPQQGYYNPQQSQATVGNYNNYNGYSQQPVMVEKPTMIKCFKKFWKNYVNFSGRSRRSEYWYVVLANVLLSMGLFILTIVIATIFGLINGNATYIAEKLGFVYAIIIFLYGAASFIPTLSLIVRRLHDLGKEWYNVFFYLIPIAGPIIILVWLFQDSQPGTNKFGENPKGIN